MAKKPLKVETTVGNHRKKRTYQSDYVFVSMLNADGRGNRWEQDPAGWEGGLGLFFSGMAALRAVAEQKGNERFKVAARAALDAMADFDPDNSGGSKKRGGVKKTKKKTTKKKESKNV